MTVIAGSLKRGGLLRPLPSSNAVSADALTIRDLVHDTWRMLVASLAVRQTAETSIGELHHARTVAAKPNWDGFGAKAVNERAIHHAVLFLQALPTTVPAPDVSVDPDGEVDVLWHVNVRKNLSVSVGPTGRLTYSGLFGDAQSYGTEWFFDEIPQTILLNIARVLDTTSH